MAEYQYGRGERARRRQRNARRRRQIIALSVVTVLVLTAGTVIGIKVWNQGADNPDDAPINNVDPQGGNEGGQQTPDGQSQPGGQQDPDGQGDPDTGENNSVPTEIPWNLVLVNPWNKMEEGYVPDLTYMYDGYSRVDSRCYEDLDDMIDALYAEDLVPVICSSYRTMDMQQTNFNNQVDYFINQGMSRSEAETAAAREVAVPGTSEHQLGLAVDIVDVNYQWLDEGQEDTAVQKWLMKNSWKYGFILRYPNDKTDITGIIYEPWHYRYVGKEYAKDIYESGLCFEEWLEQKFSA